MAFGVTSINAFGVETNEPTRSKYVQYLEMAITGTTADVILDIGDVGGTFWTSVADAEKAGVIASIYPKVDKHLSLSVPELLAKLQITSGDTVATGEYKVTLPNTVGFEITIFEDEGLTSYSLAMSWTLKEGHLPVTISL